MSDEDAWKQSTHTSMFLKMWNSYLHPTADYWWLRWRATCNESYPTPFEVCFSSPALQERFSCVCVCLNLLFSLIYHRTSSSSSITKYSSQSQSQSTRGITFDDSDDDDDEVTQWYSRGFFSVKFQTKAYLRQSFVDLFAWLIIFPSPSLFFFSWYSITHSKVPTVVHGDNHDRTYDGTH